MILCTGDEPCTGTCRSLAALGSADHPRPAAHHRPQARRQSASCACKLAPNDDKHICVTVNQRVRSGQQHRAPTHRDVTNSGQWPVGSGRVGSTPVQEGHDIPGRVHPRSLPNAGAGDDARTRRRRILEPWSLQVAPLRTARLLLPLKVAVSEGPFGSQLVCAVRSAQVSYSKTHSGDDGDEQARTRYSEGDK